MVLFCLHYLGGSAREWSQVARHLPGFEIVAIDLPGFGDAAGVPGYSVGEMADTALKTIAAAAPERYAIVGHSMGAKVAAALARRAEDGTAELAGLAGLMLVAGSPPSPEPMEEKDREEMLGWFDDGDDTSRSQAREYVAKNSGPHLDATSRDLAEADVLRADRAAWRAWLTQGSREDWADRIGVLQTPALLVAGADDANLGPDTQRRLAMPHYARARMATIDGAKHLLPLEAAADLAAMIGEHAGYVAYRATIDSARVSRGTREALLARDATDDPAYEGAALDRDALRTLRAVVDRVIPQKPAAAIDLAARIDKQLAGGVEAGDGWRFAGLPPDADAYRAGLFTLNDIAKRRHGEAYASLDGAVQDALLNDIANGSIDAGAMEDRSSARLDAAQMKLWFEDVRADSVKLYVAHPRTLARMGYGGIANGGDGLPKTGFARVGIGERESWEPLAAIDRAR